MLIIETTALSNGAHRNQTYSGTEIPEGWIAVPADMEAEAKACLPFIVLDINDEGILVGITEDTEARSACETEQPDDMEQVPALESRVDALEENFNALLTGLEAVL